MEFFDSAKNSLDVESMLINVMDEACASKTISDAHKHREPGEAIFKIEITVTQVFPEL